MYILPNFNYTGDTGIFSTRSFINSITRLVKPNEPLLVLGKLSRTSKNKNKGHIDLYLVHIKYDKKSHASFSWSDAQVEQGEYQWESFDTCSADTKTFKEMIIASSVCNCMWIPVSMTLPAGNKHSKHVLQLPED